MFRAIILPIFRSTRLCSTAPTMLPATGLQHRGCIIPQTVTHSLVLLEMCKIIARNMLSRLELLISRYFCISLVVYISDARSSKYQIATGRQHRGCIIPQTVIHSLVLLEMYKINARNMLSRLDLLISRYCCISLVVYISDARSSKSQIMKYICWLNI